MQQGFAVRKLPGGQNDRLCLRAEVHLLCGRRQLHTPRHELARLVPAVVPVLDPKPEDEIFAVPTPPYSSPTTAVADVVVGEAFPVTGVADAFPAWRDAKAGADAAILLIQKADNRILQFLDLFPVRPAAGPTLDVAVEAEQRFRPPPAQEGRSPCWEPP